MFIRVHLCPSVVKKFIARALVKYQMNIIGIGTDIAEIARIERMAEKHERSFLERVYTPGERAACLERKNSGERLAARWAAKEAVLKAFGTGWSSGIDWTDVEVVNNELGAPSIRLTGGAARIAASLGVTKVLITLSHCDTYATATALAVGE